MLAYLIDVLFVLAVASTAYFVSRQLFLNAIILFVSTLIASQFAIGTFEVIASWSERRWFLATDSPLTIYLWAAVLVGLFAFVSFLLLWLANALLPHPLELSYGFEVYGCWITGIVTGYLCASFLLLALHTLPGPRDFWGAFPPEVGRRSGPIAAMAPDYQLLLLADSVCEQAAQDRSRKRIVPQPERFLQPAPGRLRSLPVRYAEWREKIEGWR